MEQVEKIPEIKKTERRVCHLEGRTFSYYVQNVDQDSPLGLNLRSKEPVTGVIFEDGMVAWTNEPGSHEDIVTSVGKGSIARFQGIPDSRIGSQNIHLFITQNEHADEIVEATYLFMCRSSVDPRTNLKIELGSKNPRLLYAGKFSQFPIPPKESKPSTTREDKETFTPGDRAIVFDIENDRVASAWAHGQACRKIGRQFGDKRIINILRRDNDNLIVCLHKTPELKRMARAIRKAGEPGDTIVELLGKKRIPLKGLVE